MQLPGGLWQDGQLDKGFGFKPLTGRLELAVTEAAAGDQPVPLRVTAVLAVSLEQLGAQQPSTRLVGQLCVADRQFLIRQLAAHLGMDLVWLTASCDHCQEPFDFSVAQSQLPIKPASDGFPFVTVQTSQGSCRLRVPNGEDQCLAATIDDETEAMRQLLNRGILPPQSGDRPSSSSSNALDASHLTHDDRCAIDDALEAISPEVATLVQAQCPGCSQSNQVAVDPYLCLQTARGTIFDDVHTLAQSYHWSESEILAMPCERRQIYLGLVDRSRRMLAS